MLSVRARGGGRVCVCVVAFESGCLTRPWGAAPIRQNLIKRVSDLLTASQTHTHVLTCSDKTAVFSSLSPSASSLHSCTCFIIYIFTLHSYQALLKAFCMSMRLYEHRLMSCVLYEYCSTVRVSKLNI